MLHAGNKIVVELQHGGVWVAEIGRVDGVFPTEAEGAHKGGVDGFVVIGVLVEDEVFADVGPMWRCRARVINDI